MYVVIEEVPMLLDAVIEGFAFVGFMCVCGAAGFAMAPYLNEFLFGREDEE